MGMQATGVCHKLNTGSLEIRITEDLAGREIFSVAERINPKRSFLFVSTKLGRHIPVRPGEHFATINRVVDQIPESNLEGFLLVMGYAETAVGIGAAAARRIRERHLDTDLVYLSTTRHSVMGREWVAFSERHSHAAAHHVLKPARCGMFEREGVTLILVDDETTTGSTFKALFEALKVGGLPIRRLLLVTLTDWSDRAAARTLSAQAPDIPVSTFSLMRGRWAWTRNPAVELPKVPSWTGHASMPVWLADSISNPMLRAPRLGINRLGINLSEGLATPFLADLPKFPDADPVLVVGTGEHVWGPMLLAERLERDGADVHFVATTRSPVLTGKAIRHKAVIPDHFGIGVPMYLHNVPERPDAHVIVMTETGPDGICPSLRSHLGRGHIIDGSGRVTGFGV